MNLSTTGLHLAANAAIDLHLHTIYSDGDWTPEQLLDHLVQEQFDLAAITDHDRTDTLLTIQQLALEKHIPVLVGVEMSTTWKGEMVDLLCFGFDPEQNALSALTQDLLRRQQENTRQVYEKIQQQGYPLPARVLSTLLATPNVQQPHAFIAALKEHGYSLDDPSLRKALVAARLGFAFNEPTAVVEAAHRSGAICLLAHPGHGDGFVTFDVSLLDEFLLEAPLDGLEVYHPKNSPQQTEQYREYAEARGLLISAGSDSHRPDKPPIKYRAELCRGLLERVGIQIA
ncbi:MAG: PHP domain-containing protein [Anaerolineales bacterium]|nr:PHP domain-containing protein [Anaerolineales bacterium]